MLTGQQGSVNTQNPVMLGTAALCPGAVCLGWGGRPCPECPPGTGRTLLVPARGWLLSGQQKGVPQVTTATEYSTGYPERKFGWEGLQCVFDLGENPRTRCPVSGTEEPVLAELPSASPPGAVPAACKCDTDEPRRETLCIPRDLSGQAET